MKNNTVYMVAVDIGGMENFYEAGFMNEASRNEIALSLAEEMEYGNFLLNIAAWMNNGIEEEKAIKLALRRAREWYYSDMSTWEVEVYE